MNYYNKNIIAHSKKAIAQSNQFAKETLIKSNTRINKLTKPTGKALKIGSVVGILIGLGLIISGIIKLLQGDSLWGSVALAAGIATMLSNIVTLKILSDLPKERNTQ